MEELQVACDIRVYIADLAKGVPGSDLSVWQYREKVDPNWQPDPATYPGIQAVPLPTRRGNMAVEAVQNCFRVAARERQPDDWDALPTVNPVVQAVGRTDSLDMRNYVTTRWVNAVFKDGVVVTPGYDVELPPDQHKPLGPVSSLFLGTVHACFAKHHALGIRPECLMWMVLHEIGVCVKQHPEAYRDLFTDSKEKKLIDVRVDGLDIHDFGQAGVWAEGIGLLHAGLRKAMPPGLMEHLLPPISTHDLESETASMVAVLDAASPYFEYLMRTSCGIPAIRLFGEPEDYDRIVVACGQLAERFSAHLGDYFLHLLPVLREIADTAAGRKKPDNEFWTSIYNHYSGSGKSDMDGWATAFLNYTFEDGRFTPKDGELYDWKQNLLRNRGQWGRGIDMTKIPNHLSCVPFIWNYAKDHGGQAEGEFAGRNFKLDNDGNGANFDCRLVGGFLGVEDVDGFATPVLSYAVIRGKEIATTVNPNGTWTAQAEGHDPVTAVQQPVFADPCLGDRIEASTTSEDWDILE